MNTAVNAPVGTAVKKSVSITSLNLTKQCEDTFEFEYVDGSTGRGKGVFFSVLGSQAPKVQNWVRKELNQRNQREDMQKKRGKEVARTIEDNEEFNNEAAAIRLTGWRGIDEPFSFELALALIESNAEIRDQIFTASNDLSHFTQG